MKARTLAMLAMSMAIHPQYAPTIPMAERMTAVSESPKSQSDRIRRAKEKRERKAAKRLEQFKRTTEGL